MSIFINILDNKIIFYLFLVNPRYLNSDNDDEDEVKSNPRRPSPTSQTYSSSNASSVRSVDIDIKMNTKTEKNLYIRSNKNTITDIIQQEKVQFSSLIRLS